MNAADGSAKANCSMHGVSVKKRCAKMLRKELEAREWTFQVRDHDLHRREIAATEAEKRLAATQTIPASPRTCDGVKISPMTGVVLTTTGEKIATPSPPELTWTFVLGKFEGQNTPLSTPKPQNAIARK
ncbi:hypothetical protein B0H14DRAFT_2598628 [Mycena olivaceomarginata]|nr:hypothetical protein B0H14DRAFT_2598628 [Mycena olivaceomarginata]